MANSVSMMVLPIGAIDALPQILLYQGGVWRDMSPPLANRSLESVARMRGSIDALLTEVMRQMRSGVTPPWSALRATFRQYYNAIVPPGVQAALAQALERALPGEAPLLNIHIHASTEWIPWEILHDGQDFLGLSFQIARLPITPTGPNLDYSGPRLVDRVSNLLAENVFAPSLAAPLTAAWKDTFSALASPAVEWHHMPSLNGSGDGYPNVDHFMNAAVDSDILHLTCHGGLKDTQGQHYWTLNHKSSLTFTYHINATILNDLNLSNNPLVFGNACDSQAAGDSGLSPGFGSIFFARGALAFIGTFAPITQTMAVKFAGEFYRRLLGDSAVPIGQALWACKRHFADQEASDPSYLYYCLYGPADIVFQRAQ